MIFLSILDFRDNALLLKPSYELDREGRLKREERIKRENSNTPLILLITCTRIEVYSEEKRVSFESIERAFSLNHIECINRRRALEGDDVYKHLFRLSLGLDSPLFGEELILSQLKEAKARAEETRGSSSALMRLFNSSIAFSKRMHTEHKIRVFDPTISEEVGRIVGKEKKVLIVGSGELSRMVARSLLDNSCSVTMTLRDDKKIFLLEKGAKGISYDRRRDALKEVDAVISTSSGIYYTFEEEDRESLKDKLLIDLATPYDIPSYLNPIRLEDLDIKTPIRDSLVATLNHEIEKEVEDFIKDLEMKEEAIRAEDFSISILRRMRGVINNLSLSESEKKSLEDALYESTRKAYIEKERKARKR